MTAPTMHFIQPGALRSGWCTDCKAATRWSADLLLVTPDGVTTVGTFSWCEVHEDPASPLPARRTAPHGC